MPTVVVGSGPTVAVLLHQTDGNGLCGWWPYAERLARDGVRSLLFDLCGYGDASCPDEAFADDPVAQVAAAVGWARSHGARRVVLVGASMGGAIALGAAPAVSADAVVDLSGPASWGSLDSVRALSRLTVPTLVAISRSTDRSDFDALQAAFPAVPATTKLFRSVDSGHGWDMLRILASGPPQWTPLADLVSAWIRSDYPESAR